MLNDTLNSASFSHFSHSASVSESLINERKLNFKLFASLFSELSSTDADAEPVLCCLCKDAGETESVGYIASASAESASSV